MISARAAQVTFFIICAFCIACIAAASFTTGWLRDTNSSKNYDTSIGLLPWPCFGNKATVCNNFWNNSPAFYHITFISMMGALIVSSLLILLQIASMCGVQNLLFFVLIALLSLLNTAALTLAVTIFGVKTQYKTTYKDPNGLEITREWYYSFWIALAAAVLSGLMSFLALLIPFLGKPEAYMYDLRKAEQQYSENTESHLVRNDKQQYVKQKY
ncbi:unnamed protein product [Caenorhabditis auriculariae]|uniref:Uncharacterized protein n=1 Tax=Caenorhabditis auriculariae TaxID=2777116 RepID=A0A8S1HIS2_9PELO|nr:unnamed protein product [Caenorhabditis auriculariae]